MNFKNRKCKDCNKIISKGSILGFCRSCSKKGKMNGFYKHGFYTKKRYCIDCYKEIKSHSQSIRCKKCAMVITIRNRRSYKGKNNPMYGVHRFGKINPNYNNHKLNKNTIQKHHIDLNKSNNKKDNLILLTLTNHRRLHLYAYHYIVKTKQIKKYLKWFNKKYCKGKLFLQEVK